jgi:plastocyanin
MIPFINAGSWRERWIGCLLAAGLLAAGCGGPITSSHTATASPSPSTASPLPAGSSPASASPTSGQADQVVTVEEINASNMGGAFSPKEVHLSAGGTVRWVNHSGNIHNVTFDDRSLGASPIMYKGDSHEKKLDRPGRYHYVCTFHPGMEGMVVVS